ncbi:WD40 domain-contaiining protein [Encephalitozoon hellem ATCC 50504]|uniref:WD40 repeat-containing protein n=1 Tax=Encephalitozoon hellem TaxID=27973 RepID=A0A9Q9C1N2_ENCHE|nr:WD40 domain-contaiining protein [Encephalitozoon hellem ATCC 50504]AEI69238.1 WD40 domain-contaiining protein [Encephalitozoon hellem ATCC 50504]UTX42436.1 WD40 repeat-containing protein [Encephalitozoon hellem]WEL37879.1 WD40 repeat-containing protein [Encephalitozoon hellem]|eukprot:XP_003886725.1 WD40 domain-contaiining protein [Encephalitozoon hellem ATCC 50504]
MNNKKKVKPDKNSYGALNLPQELIPRIIAHLSVKYIKRLMRCNSLLYTKLRNDFSLWRLFTSGRYPCVSGYISEIRNKYTLVKNISRSRNERSVDFETKQSDLTYMQIDRDKVICSSDDQTIKIFGMDGRLVRTFIGHKGGVWTFMVNSKFLVSGSTDKTARIWDLHTGCTLCVLVGHKSVVRSLKMYEDYIVTGSRDSEIRVWNFSGTCLNVLKGHTMSVRCMDINEAYLVSGSYDGSVALWDYRKGRLLRYLKSHSLRVYSVSLSSNYVASGSLDSSVHVSSLDGRLLCSYKVHRSLVIWLKFVGNGRYLLSSGADGILCKWDILENALVYKIEENGHITAQAVIEDLLIVGTKREVKIYNLFSGRFIRTLFSASSLISKVEVSGRCISIGYYSDSGACRLIVFNY